MHARRALLHLLFALFLLLSQQAGFAHAVTHLGNGPASQDKQFPHGKICDQCVQGAQLGSALIDTSPDAGWIHATGPRFDVVPAALHSPRFICPFSSRAPPTLS
jgi:hypothetical protein